MEIFKQIYNSAVFIIGVLTFYRFIYTCIGFLFKARVYKETENYRKIGIVIAARNEQNVIGNLIMSIKNQDYPQDLITIFVVSDNSKDDTAKISSDNGAIVYERYNDKEISKGYALQYLFKKIDQDYGINSFDCFALFDADNILDSKCLRKLNDTLDSGADIATGFRNTTNFSTNFISASYGIHFFRNTLSLHRPRSYLNLSTQITGTGFAFLSEVVKNGWNYTDLTEDYEFTINAIAVGKKIMYCEAAQFYDEQPIDLKTMLRQRLRWSRGNIFNFYKNSHLLFRRIFRKPSFETYDMLLQMTPVYLVTFLMGIIFATVSSIVTSNTSFLVTFFRDYLIFTYLNSLLMGFLALIRERRRFRCTKRKLVPYLFLWPLFDLISIPLAAVIHFKRIKWLPIKHHASGAQGTQDSNIEMSE